MIFTQINYFFLDTRQEGKGFKEHLLFLKNTFIKY